MHTELLTLLGRQADQAVNIGVRVSCHIHKAFVNKAAQLPTFYRCSCNGRRSYLPQPLALAARPQAPPPAAPTSLCQERTASCAMNN